MPTRKAPKVQASPVSKPAPRKAASRVSVHPVTAERWSDMAQLFGEKGACAGCWCQFFKLPRSEYEAGRGKVNEGKQKRFVKNGGCPGLLAYVEGEPAGWCAVEPREFYPRITNSRTLKPVDDRPAWSVTCFFVARAHRRSGLTKALLEAAAEHARANGATVLEGYPVVPLKGSMPDTFAYHGLASAFRKAGFHEVASPSPSRRIMRRELGPARTVRRSGGK